MVQVKITSCVVNIKTIKDFALNLANCSNTQNVLMS